MDDINSLDARRRLLHLMGYLAEAAHISDIDGTSEAAYAALYSMGLDDAPLTQVGTVLDNDGEAAAIEQVVVHLNEVMTVIGNCETETNNMREAAWALVRDAAQTAYELLKQHSAD